MKLNDLGINKIKLKIVLCKRERQRHRDRGREMEGKRNNAMKLIKY